MKTYEHVVGSGHAARIALSLVTWSKGKDTWLHSVLLNEAEGNSLNRFNGAKVIRAIENNSGSLAHLIVNKRLRDSLYNDWFKQLNPTLKESSKILLSKFFSEIKSCNASMY